MNAEIASLLAAWNKIRPHLATIPANLKAEIESLEAHLQSLQAKAAPEEHHLVSEVQTMVTQAEGFVGKVAEKVFSKVKGA